MFAILFIGIVCRDLIPGCRRKRDLELVKCNCNVSNINHVEEKNNKKKGHETNENKKEERGMVFPAAVEIFAMRKIPIYRNRTPAFGDAIRIDSQTINN